MYNHGSIRFFKSGDAYQVYDSGAFYYNHSSLDIQLSISRCPVCDHIYANHVTNPTGFIYTEGCCVAVTGGNCSCTFFIEESDYIIEEHLDT